MLQDEYYVIARDKNSNYPLFTWDQVESEFGLGKPVEITEPLKFRFGEPIPPEPELVDYHGLPDPVVSKRIVDVLTPLDIYGIQLIPAKVRDPRSPFSDLHDYWYLHVWNQITCLDKEKSEIRTNKAGTRIFAIDKLVLDEKTLSPFELRKRQIFELAEKTPLLLLHKTVKDAIESVNPKGCRFFKATEWRSDIVFEK